MTLRIVGGNLDDRRTRKRIRPQGDSIACLRCRLKRKAKSFNLYDKSGKFLRKSKYCLHCRRPWNPSASVHGTNHIIKSMSDYAEYLTSDHWIDFQKEYRKSSRPKACFVCEDEYATLHHVSYDNLGCEYLTDVVAICNTCHAEILALHKQERASSLWQATKKYRSQHRKQSSTAKGN